MQFSGTLMQHDCLAATIFGSVVYVRIPNMQQAGSSFLAKAQKMIFLDVYGSYGDAFLTDKIFALNASTGRVSIARDFQIVNGLMYPWQIEGEVLEDPLPSDTDEDEASSDYNDESDDSDANSTDSDDVYYCEDDVPSATLFAAIATNGDISDEEDYNPDQELRCLLADSISLEPLKAKDIPIPSSLKDVQNSAHKMQWEEAIREEKRGLLEKGTFLYGVKVPKGMKPIKTRFVFDVKMKTDGTVDRFKARLVAKGFTQRYGIDYHDVYSPTMKTLTLRLMLSESVLRDADFRSFDAKQAFLTPMLEEDIYLELPDGEVVKAIKAIYGLKQASRQWYLLVQGILLKEGFVQSLYDECLFVFSDSVGMVAIAVHVDDGSVVSTNEEKLKRMVEVFNSFVEFKETTSTNLILGLQISRTATSIAISQENYVNSLLDDFMDDNKVMATTPGRMDLYEYVLNRMKDEDHEDVKEYPYRAVIGRVLYLALMTRPDISNVVDYKSPVSEVFVKTADKKAIKEIDGIIKDV
jgi:hypothetical protein